MRKRTIVALIIAASLVVLGGVIFTGAMSRVKWDFTKLSMNQTETNEYILSESYQNISIQTDTADVVIRPSETDETKVVCKEQERLKHSVTVEDGTLVIRLTDTREWTDYVLNFAFTKVTVYVPETQLKDITVKNSTGNITLQNMVVDGQISVKNSTGNVKFKDCDAASVLVKNSTGNITGNFLTEKQFVTKVSTGDVSVPDCKSGGRCEIITSTGNVKFTVGYKTPKLA